jgi:hypothetical protein
MALDAIGPHRNRAENTKLASQCWHLTSFRNFNEDGEKYLTFNGPGALAVKERIPGAFSSAEPRISG